MCRCRHDEPVFHRAGGKVVGPCRIWLITIEKPSLIEAIIALLELHASNELTHSLLPMHVIATVVSTAPAIPFQLLISNRFQVIPQFGHHNVSIPSSDRCVVLYKSVVAHRRMLYIA